MPSLKYCCFGSLSRLVKGSTTSVSSGGLKTGAAAAGGGRSLFSNEAGFVALIQVQGEHAGDRRGGDHQYRHACIELPMKFLPAGVFGGIFGFDQRPGERHHDRETDPENDDDRREGSTPAKGRQGAAREWNQEPRNQIGRA